MDKFTVSVIIPHNNKRPEMLKEAIQSVKDQTYPALEIIEANCLSQGDSRWNKAIKESKGTAYIILSDDDKLDPTYIEKTVAVMEKTRVDIVATWLECFGEGAVGGESGCHGPGKHPFITSLVRKSIFDKTTGFDFKIGPMSDVEFWWRCFEAGARWEILGEPLFKYRKHKGQFSNFCDWDESRKKVLAKNPNYSW